MRSLKRSVWLLRISVAAILILSLKPTSLAAHPQEALAKTGELRSSFQQIDTTLPSSSSSNESVYDLQPLPASAQNAPQAGQAYLGLNPAQALRILFTPTGLDVSAQSAGDLPWQLQMNLEGVARENGAIASISAASTQVAGNRIEYRYSDIREWYVNDKNGLKQGFRLDRPLTPAATEPLQLRLQIGGNLLPSLSRDRQAIDFVTASGAALLRYDALHVFDAQQTTLPAYFSITQSGIAINIDDRNAVYPITVDPLLTSYLMKRTAADAAANDFLGYDVNISHGIAIVGVYGDDNENGEDAGVVYLYAQNQGGSNQWGQRARLVAGDGQAGDEFGKDVYVTFGVTATVGAPGDDDKGNNAGAAYLFAQNQGGANNWGQLIKLTASDGAADDAFGAAVAVQHHTAVVGAPGEDSKGSNAGAVYVFEQPDPAAPTNWIESKIVTAPDGAAGDAFGAAVVVSGDFLIVGAPKDDDACPQDPDCDSGSIYIFARNQGGANQWGLLHKRTAADASAGDLFGTSLNFSTDRVIVGAPGDDEKASDAGAAYIFERNYGSTDGWNARPKIMAPDGAANDQFGRSVGIGGNIAIVGAPFGGDSGVESGSAYLVFFRWPGVPGEWGKIIKIMASDAAGGDQFGFSVDARAGHIVIGAPMESDGGDKAGAAYFYTTPFSVGTLRVANNVEPNDPNTNWNYTIEGTLTHTDTLAGDGESVPTILFSGAYTITESAGANTNAGNYETTWDCTVDGEPGSAGDGSSLTIFVGLRQNVVCNFTHIRAGTITIVKETRPAGGTDFEFTDNIAAPNSFTLDDQGSKLYENVTPGTYEVTENVPADWRVAGIECQDLDGGSVANGATATIDLDAGEAVTCVFSNKTKDGITIIKSANVTIAGIGQTITYTYQVINDSQDALTGIVATDDKLGNIPLDKTTLAPSEQTTGVLSYTVVGGDLPGPLTNTALVTGTPPSGPVVTDTTSLSINLVGSAALAVSITADPTNAAVEDTVTYSYRITNTGLAPLTNVVAVDKLLGKVALVDTSLQPSESTTGAAVYTVVDTDLPGPLINTVNVTGTPPIGPVVVASASAAVTLSQEAALAVSVTASTDTAAAGDTITYTYEIRNTGGMTFTAVAGVDDRLGEVPLAATSLEPGASTTGTLSYTVLESDPPGPLVNTVTATANTAGGAGVESEATVSVTVIGSEEQPALNLPWIAND